MGYSKFRRRIESEGAVCFFGDSAGRFFFLLGKFAVASGTKFVTVIKMSNVCSPIKIS